MTDPHCCLQVRCKVHDLHCCVFCSLCFNDYCWHFNICRENAEVVRCKPAVVVV